MKERDLRRIEALRKEVKIFNSNVWQQVEKEIKIRFSEEEYTNILLYIPKARIGYGANRPYSCFLGFLFGGGDPENQEIIKASAALEILNSSITYIDDKIFDDDIYVGNSLSLHRKYGIPFAIIVSSTFRSIARRLITEIAPKNTFNYILKEIDDISIEADYGQYMDIKYGQLFNATIDDAVKINDFRTGQFIRRCAEIGYLFGDKYDKTNLSLLHKSFKLYGRAVQDINDFDDVNFSEGSPGSHGMDLKLFKKTKPILKALELANSRQRKIILSVLGNPNAEDKAIIEACLVIRETGALKWAYNDINKTINEAITIIEKSRNPISKKIIDYFSIAKVVMNKHI